MKKNDFPGYDFSREEEFEKIYADCLEKREDGPDKVAEQYKIMVRAFEKYIAAYNDDVFRYAYCCGYSAAKNEGERSGWITKR